MCRCTSSIFIWWRENLLRPIGMSFELFLSASTVDSGYSAITVELLPKSYTGSRQRGQATGLTCRSMTAFMVTYWTCKVRHVLRLIIRDLSTPCCQRIMRSALCSLVSIFARYYTYTSLDVGSSTTPPTSSNRPQTAVPPPHPRGASQISAPK